MRQVCEELQALRQSALADYRGHQAEIDRAVSRIAMLRQDMQAQLGFIAELDAALALLGADPDLDADAEGQPVTNYG